MRWGTRDVVRATAAAVAVVTLGACAPTTQTPQPPPNPPENIRLYGTDGNMANSVAALLEGYPTALVGMKGTTPLTPLSQSFRDRLRQIDSKLTDNNYAGESYDAVVISALAARIAKSSDPQQIAAQITGVTTRGETCETPKECFDLVAAGKDIAYKGISLRLGGFTDVGEPSAATYGILRFSGQNTVDAGQTEYVQAGDPLAGSTKRPPAPGAGGATQAQLKIGTLLPRTGQLASSGPPMFAAVQLAINDVNALGGVGGQPIVYVEGDDGTDPKVAQATVERLISEGVQIIIGAGASGISNAVLPTTVAAGVILFSPCNTAAALTGADDKGLYFRTAPADDLQATALTNLIMRDGVEKLAIVARDDAYGKGLMDAVKANLVAAGLTDADVKTMPYTSDAPDFSGLGDAMKAFGPDGVLIIGYDESANAYKALFTSGFTSRAI